MRRRAFCATVPALLFAAAACGDDDDGPRADAAPSPDANDIDAGPATEFAGVTADSSGHFHTFTVQCADLSAGTATYTATGSGHNHTVMLNAIQLSNLASGGTVTFDTNDSHAHSWSVTKPSNAC